MKKKLPLLILFVAFGFLLINRRTDRASLNPKTEPSPTNIVEESTKEAEIEQNTQLSFTATANDQTALELLDNQAEIEFKDYGEAGKFITSINGLAANEKNFWAFYLNGEKAQTGASQTKLEEGDIIEFIYEKIDPNQF